MKVIKLWRECSVKKIDLTGQHFGYLTVIKETSPYISPSGRKRTQWECLCECGNKTIVKTENLRSGHTISCGCACGRIDHTGEKFGRLTAIKHLNGGEYLCKCDCGTEVKVRTYNLTNGNTQSCGCLQKERTSEASFISLIGNRFGKLTVLQRVKNNSQNQVCYLCQCDCGGTTIVNAPNLRSGTTSSCGCIKSKGESAINQWLTTHKINFIPQYSHPEIFLESGRKPSFDFAIFNKDNQLFALIEYQGKQHYEYSGYGWDNEENYQKTVSRDIQRRKWCQKLNIPLYEIPYWEFDNLEKILYNIIREVNLLNE